MGSPPPDLEPAEPSPAPTALTSLVVPTARREPARDRDEVTAHPGRDPSPEAVPRDAPPREIGALLRQHFARVWRTAHRFGCDRREAEEAAQQAFTILSARLERVAPGRELPFLVGVVAHLAANARRRRRNSHEILSDRVIAQTSDPRANPEELLVRRRARQQLEALLDRLPQPHREVFVLFELEEMPLQEIAAALAIPVGTAATRLRRARVLFHSEVARLRSREAALDRKRGRP